ncbi:MAG: TRAP transporter substrate-binding protein [Geminicoccaceae bacterium]|nr:TRAP transporter substrate-binding protein [Geminicoccaceae bacterium]
MKRRAFVSSAGLGGVAAGAGVVASGFPRPAIAQERIEMNIVSTWPRDFPGLGTGAQRLARNIADLSEGRIQVQYFAAGERVGAFDAFDEVASGNAQAYHGADYYWKGKHPAFSYFTTVPMGLTYTEAASWLHFMGGQELWDELAGEFGLKNLSAGNSGVQMGGWFNKEMESPDDFKGLKMRIPGLGGDVISKLGGSPVSLPGGQIYENLVSGALDATEWVGPWNDYFLKFYEAAKYYYWPGMHEPGSILSFGMNKAFWDGLSANDQMLIRACCSIENDFGMAEFNANNGVYLDKLINEHGVALREFNDDIYEAFAAAAEEVFEETRQHGDLTNRVHESFLAARKGVGGWMKLADVGYSVKRNRGLGL